MAGHALLSASSSHRWLNCPPSARLCENYEDRGSEYEMCIRDRPNCYSLLSILPTIAMIKRVFNMYKSGDTK